MSSAISVRQLNFYIKSLLEADGKLAFISVIGEISNFKEHFSSGHLYFTLKDESAAIKCVMFNANARRLKFLPKDGMKVVVRGRISVFERDGAYQLYAEDMTVDGEGDLLQAFEQLKEKLEKEGLFSSARKKAIPPFPSKIAVITSSTGAAVKDIFNVLTRRYPIAKVELIPAIVQGAEAPMSLCKALDIAYNDPENQVIIIGRGGGSVEDLWCFNDEGLARKIAESKIPVISAVGHETDFTICDFVSDLRAPTPSAAAELAVPDIDELSLSVNTYSNIIFSAAENILTRHFLLLDKVKSLPVFSKPSETLIEKKAIEVDRLADNIFNKANEKFENIDKAFTKITSKIDALSPLKTLARGYSVAVKGGKAVTDSKALLENDNLNVKFSKGSADCKVIKVYEE